MSIGIKNVGGGGAETYREPVNTFGELPIVGNQDGDLRVALDTHELYVWNEGTTSWDLVVGGGGASNSFQTISTPSGTSPVADSATDTLTLSSSDSNIAITGNSTTDSIDFTLAPTISGSKTFSSQLNLSQGLNANGLEVQALSSTVILLDNTSIETTAFSIPLSYDVAVIDYSIKRDSSRKACRLFLINNASVVGLSDDGIDLLNDSGVTFSALVNGANIDVKYTTSSTGFNANLKYSVKRWIS